MRHHSSGIRAKIPSCPVFYIYINSYIYLLIHLWHCLLNIRVEAYGLTLYLSKSDHTAVLLKDVPVMQSAMQSPAQSALVSCTMNSAAEETGLLKLSINRFICLQLISNAQNDVIRLSSFFEARSNLSLSVSQQ